MTKKETMKQISHFLIAGLLLVSCVPQTSPLSKTEKSPDANTMAGPDVPADTPASSDYTLIPQEKSGTVEEIIFDNVDGSSRFEHLFTEAGTNKRYSLNVPSKDGLKNLRALRGRPVKVKLIVPDELPAIKKGLIKSVAKKTSVADLLEVKLDPKSPRAFAVSSTHPVLSNGIRTFKTALVHVNYLDYQAKVISQPEIEALKMLFSASSWGRFNLRLSSEDVYVVTVNRNFVGCHNEDYYDYYSDAVSELDRTLKARGKVNDYNRVVAIVPGQPRPAGDKYICTWRGIASLGSVFIEKGLMNIVRSPDPTLVAHEMGHTFGLYHSGRDDNADEKYSSGDVTYGDEGCLMGNTSVIRGFNPIKLEDLEVLKENAGLGLAYTGQNELFDLNSDPKSHGGNVALKVGKYYITYTRQNEINNTGKHLDGVESRDALSYLNSIIIRTREEKSTTAGNNPSSLVVGKIQGLRSWTSLKTDLKIEVVVLDPDRAILNITGSAVDENGPAPVKRDCVLDGQSVPHGTQIRAYQYNTGSSSNCSVSELRLCSDGNLSGSYPYRQCNVVNSPVDCLFNGKMVPHGTSVTAYRYETGTSANCSLKETRLCSNGILSGSYSYSSCVVSGPSKAMITTIVNDAWTKFYKDGTLAPAWFIDQMYNTALAKPDTNFAEVIPKAVQSQWNVTNDIVRSYYRGVFGVNPAYGPKTDWIKEYAQKALSSISLGTALRAERVRLESSGVTISDQWRAKQSGYAVSGDILNFRLSADPTIKLNYYQIHDCAVMERDRGLTTEQTLAYIKQYGVCPK